MAKKTDNLVEEIPQKPTMEEVVEESEVLRAQAELEDAEAKQKAEEEAKTPKVEINPEAERERTKKEVTEAVTKDVVEPLKKEIIDLKAAMAPEEKDDYDKFVDDYKEKNGKAPEWKQVATFLEDRAVQRVKDEQAKATQEAKDAEDASKKQQEDQASENFKTWQGQLQEMEDKGMLPKMDKPEAGDAGFDARVQLYGLMQNTWKTTAPSTNLWEVHAKFKDQLNTGGQPSGADAPVSIGNGGGSADDGKDYKYSEVHRGAQDLESFALNELQKVGKA